ncbi:unnamed protein product [Schistosoma margrebowiei]|uniref:Teneurin-1-4-like galactose-binding domain-containing protein n=1 Tax=Schistosoma margrebowiei TaxID=48269 RepID=A0A183M7T0_9TREM|nr:unnamed protein product [Schistosoma margrebowiei]
MEDKKKGIKETLTSTCQEVFGHNKLHHKEQIYMETLNKIQERKNKKSTINNSQTRTKEVDALAGYTESNKKDELRETGRLHYLDEGIWFLALVNDQPRREPIKFAIGDAGNYI